MKFILSFLLVLAACDGKTNNGTPVHRGDPTKHPPVKKEKAPVIITNFKNLDITIDCGTDDCGKNHEPSLQALDSEYTNFSNRKKQITQISLGDTDVTFDAKSRFLIMPIQLTDQMVSDFFKTLTQVETLEHFIHINFSFSKDVFKPNVIQKALYVASQNKIRLRPLAAKISWIDFDGDHPGCTDKTWSLSRDDFENHFDQSFAAVQKCLSGN